MKLIRGIIFALFTALALMEQAQAVLYWGRAYDPNIQRWIQRDPIGERGGINLYGFVGNNPVNFNDPYGLSWYDYIPGIGPGAAQAQGVAALNAQVQGAGYVNANDFAQSHPYYNPDNTAPVQAVAQIAAGSADLYLNAATMIGQGGVVTKAAEPMAQGIADAADSGWWNKLKNLFKKKCPEKAPEPPNEPFVKLYHQGNLENGVSPTRPLSTSPTPDLTHYDPDGQLYQFNVPQSVLNQWLQDGSALPFNDLHAPTQIVSPEIRITPAASGQMNQYMVK